MTNNLFKQTYKNIFKKIFFSKYIFTFLFLFIFSFIFFYSKSFSFQNEPGGAVDVNPANPVSGGGGTAIVDACNNFTRSSLSPIQINFNGTIRKNYNISTITCITNSPGYPSTYPIYEINPGFIYDNSTTSALIQNNATFNLNSITSPGTSYI